MIRVATAAVLFVVSLASHAGFYEGLAAFERRDYAEAMTQWRPLADKGIAVVQNNLGVMYDHGLGVEENDAEAVRWYRLAADQGNAQAQYSLGLMYGNGHGVEEDDRAAVGWYRLAAEQGSAAAQYHLALVYDFGEGVIEDDAAAATWYRRAAEQGDHRAQYNLGLLLDFGNGVPENDGEAVQWYRRAAEQGDSKAQYMLGVSFFTGEGVRRDLVNAYAWVTLAASQRHVRAVQARGEVWAAMNANERKAGRALRRRLSTELALRKRLEMPDGADQELVLPPKELIRDIQVALSGYGFDPGPADGVLGHRTRDALRAFQRAAGLAETGEPRIELLKLLRLRAAAAN